MSSLKSDDMTGCDQPESIRINRYQPESASHHTQDPACFKLIFQNINFLRLVFPCYSIQIFVNKVDDFQHSGMTSLKS